MTAEMKRKIFAQIKCLTNQGNHSEAMKIYRQYFTQNH